MRQVSTVIEIGTGKVVSVICEAGKLDETHILGSSSVSYAGYKNRKWLDKRSVAPAIMKALHEAEHIAGKRSKTVHIGIPGDFLRVVCRRTELELDKPRTVTQGDVQAIYRKSRSSLDVPKDYVLLHKCPIGFMLDDARKTMEPIGRRAKKITVVLSYVFAEKWFVQLIRKILSNNGYTPSTLIGATYAEAVRYIPEEKRDHSAVMIDIGKTSTTVMVAKGDGLTFHTTIGFGGANITDDLVKVLKTTPELAEELKKRSIYGLSLGEDDYYEVCDKSTYKFHRFSAVEVQGIIEARLREMMDFVIEALDKSGCKLPHYVPVFVTGGTALMRGIREFVQKETNHNTVIVSPRSTCFNQPSYSSALAVAELALEAEADDDAGFFESIKNFFNM